MKKWKTNLFWLKSSTPAHACLYKDPDSHSCYCMNDLCSVTAPAP